MTERWEVRNSERAIEVRPSRESDGLFDYEEFKYAGYVSAFGHDMTREQIDRVIDGFRIDFPSLRKVRD